jgi:DNA repair photolyase
LDLAVAGDGLPAGLLRTRVDAASGTRCREVLLRDAVHPLPTHPGWSTAGPYQQVEPSTPCGADPPHPWCHVPVDGRAGLAVHADVERAVRRQAARPSWRRPAVLVGGRAEPYPQVESRYRLMPGLLTALGAAGSRVVVLTQSALVARDLPVLAAVARVAPVSVVLGLAGWDPQERPGALAGDVLDLAPGLSLVRRVRAAGLECQVVLAHVMPVLSDQGWRLDRTLAALAEAGAGAVGVEPLHLTPAVEAALRPWLAARHPALLHRYGRLYPDGPLVAAPYRTWLDERVGPLLDRHALVGLTGSTGPPGLAANGGLGGGSDGAAEQLALL